MSMGIIWMLSTPRTIKVSDITVTAYGFPSEARIKPFMRNLSEMIDVDSREGEAPAEREGSSARRKSIPSGMPDTTPLAGKHALPGWSPGGSRATPGYETALRQPRTPGIRVRLAAERMSEASNGRVGREELASDDGRTKCPDRGAIEWTARLTLEHTTALHDLE